MFSLPLPVVIVTIVELCTLTSIPAEDAAGFRRRWRWKLTRKVDRMWLSSCPPVGYAFGFVTECRKFTAFTIADVIVNSVTTLALLSLDK